MGLHIMREGYPGLFLSIILLGPPPNIEVRNCAYISAKQRKLRHSDCTYLDVLKPEVCMSVVQVMKTPAVCLFVE